MKRYNIVQIGVGGWGWSWTGVLMNSPYWNLVGIVDIDKSLAEKSCAHYGLDLSLAFTSLTDALERVNANAALVVVPPQIHAKVAVEAMHSGLHCLVEKPLAGSISDALEMVGVAEATNKKLMVSQNYRFKSAPRTVRRLVQEGAIGEIGSVFINFQKSPPFTGFRAEMDEPLITDMAIHHFDQVRGLLGLEPKRVLASSWNPTWSWFRGNATANVLFEMTNGARVVYTGSWVSRGWETTWDGDWRIQGTEGEIYWANNEVIVRPSNLFNTVYMERAVEKNGAMYVQLESMEQQERLGTLQEFAFALDEDRSPETHGKDNLYSMAMVIAATISEKSGSYVDISDVIASRISQT